MSEGRRNKSAVVFFFGQSERDKIKTYLPVNEKWPKKNNVMTKMNS